MIVAMRCLLLLLVIMIPYKFTVPGGFCQRRIPPISPFLPHGSLEEMPNRPTCAEWGGVIQSRQPKGGNDMDWEFEDLEDLGREELASRLEEVLAAQADILAEEPEEESEEHEEWEDALDDLRDLQDELEDLLDELDE
jgi:hypothetical protein